MKHKLTVFFLYCFIFSNTHAQFLWNLDRMLEIKESIHSPSYANAYARLLEDAEKALTKKTYSVTYKEYMPPSGNRHDYVSLSRYAWPDSMKSDGLPYKLVDGISNPELEKYDRIPLGSMAGAVNTLSLAYFYSGDERYAAKAVEFLRVWFLNGDTKMNRNLSYAQFIPGENDSKGRSVGLIDTYSFVEMLSSLKLLTGSISYTPADDTALQEWFSDFSEWWQQSEQGIKECNAKNNHGLAYDVQLTAYLLFAGKQSEAMEIIKKFPQKRLFTQIEPDGKQPQELRRTLAFHYSEYNIRHMIDMFAISHKYEPELCKATSEDGRNFYKAVDYLIPYLGKDLSVWPYQQLSGWDNTLQAFCEDLYRIASMNPAGNYYQELYERYGKQDITNRNRLLYGVLDSGSASSFSDHDQSKLVYIGENKKLEYTPYTDKGDIIPDFSHCGYMGGGVAIPDIRVVGVVSGANGKDDTEVIQGKIDSVAELMPDESGFRGAILIKKGVYRISSPLVIKAGGIVLRGEGNHRKNGTVFLAVTPKKYNVIELGIDAKLIPEPESERMITDEYVPSGSRILHVKDADKVFKPGDQIVIHRPSTAGWIHDIGMDSIAPRPLNGETTYESFLRYRRYGENTNLNGTRQWKEGTKDLLFERKIMAVEGDRITFDIPVVNALQREYGGARVYKYVFPERISFCGVENIYGMCMFDPSVKENNKYIGEYNADENHANNFVYCKAVEHAWVRNVSVEHYDCCVWTTPSSRFVTGQELSATNPVSVITGGRRYAYSVWGQMCLFQQCYSSHHRHEFVLGASVAGPNAFVDGHGDMTFASSEPHQRWAAGCLYDNITIKGPDGSLLAVNRGWYGSGHGWSGAQIVFWNCSAPAIMVMQPPTAQNFSIGNSGVMDGQEAKNTCLRTINAINGVSRSNFKYQGVPVVGDGWIEYPASAVYPKSLYYMQLRERKPGAVVPLKFNR